MIKAVTDDLLGKGVDEPHIIETALDDRSNKELRDPDNMLEYVRERIIGDKAYHIILDEVQLMDDSAGNEPKSRNDNSEEFYFEELYSLGSWRMTRRD